MFPHRRILCCMLLLLALAGHAQRKYAASSVLANGNWFRIGVKDEGMYKVDLPFLQTLGVNTTSLASASIRLYGNGAGMLSENNAAIPIDDLFENAIEMVDGGDGIFNGSDYFIFYASGTSRWEKDSLRQSFRHRKNLYGDTAFFYLSTGGTGRRIPTVTNNQTPTVLVNSYQERLYHENDLENLLSSGKEWYGEAFSNNTQGGGSSRSFTVQWPGLLPDKPVTLVSDIASRSVGGDAVFMVSVNGVQVQSMRLPAVSGNFIDQYATGSTQQSSFVASQTELNLVFNYQSTAQGAKGWLNRFELHGSRDLSVVDNAPLLFRHWPSVGASAVARFSIANSTAGLQVWDITEPLLPSRMKVDISGTQASFTNDASRLREYIAFHNGLLRLPIALGKVENQNLHQPTKVDYIIVTNPAFLPEAKRLAAFHEQRNALKTIVVTTEQVYHEFGGGMADPTAIRDFVKMYFDKAGPDSTQRPKCLLLFGSASYDYRYRIKGNSQPVPCYQSANSLDPLSSFTSDDFFGLLDDGDDINQLNTPAQLDIAVGRIPIRTPAEAAIMVDKIIRYHAKESLGNWRGNLVFVADDKDFNLHLADVETVAASAAINPLLNQDKIYLDAYPVSGGSGGARYPAVNEAIVNKLNAGALIFNYSGHGNYLRLADEAVVSADELNRLNNSNRLPLFITASCDFYPFDDPLKNSLGAQALTRGPNGAIALLTTARLVFAFSNRNINDNYFKESLRPDADGRYPGLGESVRRAKNRTVQHPGDILNTRKFVLLGDPAMSLAFPALQVRLTSVNGKPVSGADTLHALTAYEMEGMITDTRGNLVPGFQGTIYPTVFNKPQTVATLGNDAASPVTTFLQQTNILYKGNARVENGRFRFSFVMPKDVGPQAGLQASPKAGRARISLYADNAVQDAGGADTSFFIAGAGNAQVKDVTGPIVKAFLNDTAFRNGGLTHEHPVLLARFFDSSGINTSGNGIGHDITLTIDGNERQVFVLNNFYEALPNSYREGMLRFSLPQLAPGPHWLQLKAWDVANNSGDTRLDFVVEKRERLVVRNLHNFPNPFVNNTIFSFEHNQPATNLQVTIAIYHSNGKLVKRIYRQLHTAGTRNVQLSWNGCDEHGRRLQKGIYIYRVMIAAGGYRHAEAKQLILF